MENTKYNTADVKKCCEVKLNIEFRDSKEFNGWFWLDDKKVTRITVPKGRKFIPPKTYGSMARQLRLTVNEFDDLLDCPLNKANYENLLIDRLRM